MKIKNILWITCLVIVITGCSKEYESTTDPNTVFKLFDMNLAEHKSSHKFNLTNTDESITGFVTITDKGFTTFNSMPVIQTDVTTSLTSSNGHTSTNTSSNYSDPTKRGTLFEKKDTGIVCSAIHFGALPTTAKPNEFGFLSTLECSDNKSVTARWDLKPSTNGLANLAFWYTIIDSSALIMQKSEEEHIFTIDTLGNVKNYKIKVRPSVFEEVIFNSR